MIKVAINGFGRIGRQTFKAGLDIKGLQFVAINDLTDAETLGNLLTYDTVYGKYDKTVKATKKELIIDGKKVKVFNEKDPSKLPWKKLGIDLVLECTGVFRTKDKAQLHIDAGAKSVIISAPAKDDVVNSYILGVNSQTVKKGERIIDNASCTTNCTAPVANVMQEAFGIKKALMTTIHAVTADQALVDGPHKDMRRARSAMQNIIPTTTGAAIATTKIIPKLKKRFDGISVRVPVIDGSLIDFVFVTKKKVTVEEVNKAFIKASKSKHYKHILKVSTEPLVSSDIIGQPYSAIVDLPFTKVVGNDLVKVLAWYDNERGYACRLAELALDVGKKIKK